MRETYDLIHEVEFLGAIPQERVRELCASATLMVLACIPDEIGNRDALPTTLLEALALDVPTVSTRLTGIPEIVGPESGIVVPAGDEPALTEAMSELDRRLRNGEVRPGAARKRAERLFDLQKNVGQLREHFARCANRELCP